MTVPTAGHRLGLDAYGASEPLIGNVLLYPRRVVLEVLKLSFQQVDLFTPVAADGTAAERNPFLLKYAADGSLAPDSRLMLTDSAADTAPRGEARPRIVVERAGGKFSGTTFSQRNWTGLGGAKTTRSSDLYETTVTVRCVGRTKLESELLALCVQMLLQMFAEEIRRKSDLTHLSPPEVGETALEKGDSVADQFATTVRLSAVQSINWVKSKINARVVEDVCVQIAEIAL